MVVSDCGEATLGGFSYLRVTVREVSEGGQGGGGREVGRVELEGAVAEGVVVIGASVPCGPVRCDLGVEAHEVRVREAELGNRRERRGGEIYVAEVGEEGANLQV